MWDKEKEKAIDLSRAFSLLGTALVLLMVRPAGLEPAAYSLEGYCSIQLS